MTDPNDEHAEDPPRTGWNSRGASISMVKDPRMSKLLAWVWVMLGGAIVSGTWIAANNLYQINLTLAADAVYKQELSRQVNEQREMNTRQEEHINYIDRRVYTLEGKNLRGGTDGAAHGP